MNRDVYQNIYIETHNHLHCIVAPVLNLLTKAGDVDKLDEGLEDSVEVVKDTLDPVDDNLEIIIYKEKSIKGNFFGNS